MVWIIHSIDQIVMVYLLKNGQYERASVYDREGVIQVETVEGPEIALKEVFENNKSS